MLEDLTNMKKPSEQSTDIKCLLEELQHPLTSATDGVTLLREYSKGSPVDARREQLFNTVQSNLERACALLDGMLKGLECKPSTPSVHFDILNQIQQVCSTHDKLFLQRQLRYKVTASADLPKAFANPDQIFVVLSHLISNAVKFAPRGSEIEIRARELSLRQGAGVEVSIVNESADFTEQDRYQIFERFYSASETSKAAGLGLALCREIVQKAGGQLWVDIPVKGKVAFAFVVPCAEVAAPTKPKGHQTFKYDITIANFGEIKERFGREKGSVLLGRVEEFVRKLVRYPIDVVAAFENNGIVSTIYETQEGNASSVAARISQKLGQEGFKIGKTSVEVMFKYHLSVLQ